MKDIEKLTQLIENWADTCPENKNKMDEIQKQIVETRNKIEDYPIELVNLSKDIKLLNSKKQYMDNYTIIEECLKLFEKYNIKYDKEINIMNPNTEEIITEIWRIKVQEYNKNPKYDTIKIMRIIERLIN